MEHTPSAQQLATARSDIGEPQFIEAGGFKAVFKGTVSGRVEAIKLVYVPPAAQEDASPDEIPRRVKREIEALRLCQTNRLVKLGTIQLQPLCIEGRNYLIYSEEFLNGETLKARIAHTHLPTAEQISH